MSKDIKAGGAYVELLLKSQSFVAGLRSASAKLKNFGDAAKRIGSLGMLGGGGGLGRLFAGAGAAAAVAWPVKLAANLEVAKAEFQALIGNVDQANKLFAEMQQFALVSPLGVKDLADAGRKLLVAGTAVDEIMPKLKQLGEIAGGNGEKMNLLALAFAQCTSKGRLMGQEANQMAESGFSPLAEISRTTGESIGDLMKKMEAGQISVAMVSKALETATGAGGRFNGLLAKIAGTAAGQFDQFKESIAAAVTPLGEALLPSLKQLLNIVNGGMPSVAKILKENAGSFVAMATAAAGVAAGASAIISFGIAAKVAGIALGGIATTLGLLLNPITLVAGAVAGLGYWFATSTEWGRTMVSSLATWFNQLKDIAADAFSGIGDALAAGEIQAAWKIAMLGLQTGMLQATQALKEYWYSFRQVFVQATLDMIYGAQSYWAAFVATVKSYWAGLVTDSRTVGEKIGHYLTKSSDPALAADQEAAHNVVLDQIKAEGAADKQRIAATKDAEIAAIAEQQRVAKGIAEEAFFAEMKGLDDDLAAAKRELETARANARAARDKAGAAIGGAPGFAGGKFNPANMMMDAGTMKNQILGSYSLAQLQAQAGGASDPLGRMADLFRTWTKEERQQRREFMREWREANRLG